MGRANRWDFNHKGREKLREVKRELCRIIRSIQARENYTQTMMAFHMGTSQSNVSRVVHFNVDELTVNQLFRYLVLLRPEFEMLIAI